MPSPLHRFIVNASWLIKLRWVATVGQLATVAVVTLVFRIDIDALWALAVVIGLTGISNVALMYWFSRWYHSAHRRPLPWDLVLGLVMVMDMLSLTTLLFATGGPNNPFLLFFFVNLSLCAMVLSRIWAWGLNVLSILCFGWLLYDYHQIEQLNLGQWMQPARTQGGLSLQQWGLLVAFATCASVIVYFMTRLNDELEKQQQEVRRAQVQQARSEKLEALGTLAAGAAHELATPLSTIAVVARDVAKAFDEHPPDFPGSQEVIEDLHLIRSQLDRCRKILDRMASHGAQSPEVLETVTVAQLTETVLEELPERQRVELRLPSRLAAKVIQIPLNDLSQAIRGLVQNALDADKFKNPVFIEIDQVGLYWKWLIRDRGSGISPDILDRISEPFFTTKAPGQGMGLGVFLAMNVIQRLGGWIEFESDTQKGTLVTLSIPRQDS